MKTYIGTKIIKAEPRAKNYGPIEQQGQPGYTVVYPDGYTSWSPAEAFEGAYRASEGESQALTFGDALHYLKHYHKVARAGWNGKGLHVRIIRAGNAMDHGDAMKDCFGLSDGNGNIQPGWVASTGDLLANDWQVL